MQINQGLNLKKETIKRNVTNILNSHKSNTLNCGFFMGNKQNIFGIGEVGGWKDLGRASGTTQSITGLPNKRYYMILTQGVRSTGAPQTGYRLGNGSTDTGTNYSWRYSDDGGADSTITSSAVMLAGRSTSTQEFNVAYLANFSTKEKFGLLWSCDQSTSGAGTAPTRRELIGKWSNTSNSLDRVVTSNEGSGGFDSSSETVVLGWDPADTHTDSFWTELDSVQASGSSTTFSTNTFTAKKYLWIQGYFAGYTSDVTTTFNGDTGSNYTRRYSVNGGADGTSTSTANLSNMVSGGNTTPSFWNCFIINVSSKEKLVLSWAVSQNTAGAGNATQRIEYVGKWTNTSNQITSITQTSAATNFSNASIMKVWGSD